MNSSLNISTADGFEKRLKRDTREDVCTGLEYGSVITEMVADVAGDINSVPVVGEMTGIVTGCCAAVSHITKAGMNMASIALGCDDIPFEEIKDIMNKRFNEVGRKLDQNTEALAKVSSMVGKTYDTVEKMRLQMNKSFNRVVDTIENIAVKEKVSQIHNFVEYFANERDRIDSLHKDEYIAKLEEENGILSYLKDSRTPGDDSLHTPMYEIIKNNLAIPENANDLKAFQALYALFYGVQTYVSVFAFLMETNSYLADFHYQKGNYERFNELVDRIKTVFGDFNFSLVGKSSNAGLLAKVDEVFKTVKSKTFINDVTFDIYKQVDGRFKIIEALKKQIKEMTLPIIKDRPPTATIQFKKPDYTTPLGGWKDGITVRYAVQYEKDGTFSKLSDWSESITIKNKACPYVRIPIDREGRNRLIFRQLGNNQAEQVAILNKSKTEFRDIDRDFYNAAGSIYKDEGLEEAAKFIEYGANVNAKFELGRTALHNAAKAGNVKMMNLLIENDFLYTNIKDIRGYTPLHIAADNGRSGFAFQLASHVSNLNTPTKVEHCTPLHLAVRNGFKSVVLSLSQKLGTDGNAQDKNGFTPLHYAMNGGSRLIMALFLKRNLDLNAKSAEGLTPAHLAAIKDNYEAIKTLNVDKKFDINTADINNMTPLHYAAMLGNFETLRKMIKIKGINLNIAAIGNKWTALHFAIYFKKDNVAIELITNSKIKVNAKAKDNVTPLHMAALTGQENVVQELLKKNVDVEEKTSQGYTALHFAAMHGEIGVVVALVDKGASAEAKTNSNETPLDVATKYKRDSVKEYLASNSGRRFRKSIPSETSHSDVSGIKLRPTSLFGIAAASKNVLPFKSWKLLEHGGLSGSSIQDLDSNSILLLLDVLLRKFTEEKYESVADKVVSEFEARARALSITERFEKFLMSLNNASPGEQIDLSEVYSRVKKSLMSGRGSKVTKILCSYVEMLSSLKPEDRVKMMESFMSTDPILLNSQDQAGVDLFVLLDETCTA